MGRGNIRQQFSPAGVNASKWAEVLTANKNLLDKKKFQPRDVADPSREREEVTLPLTEAASIDDRIVSIPEPDEQVPEPVKKKGIVSVNGEDVESDKDRAA